MKINCKYSPFYGDLIIDFNGEILPRLHLNSIQVKEMLYTIPLGVLEEIVTMRTEDKMKKEKNELRDYIIAYANKVINDVYECEDMDKLHIMAKMVEDYTGNKREREWTTRNIEDTIDEQIKGMKEVKKI